MALQRIIFMGTPDFAVPCLDILLKNGYEIPAVVTQPDRRRGRGQKIIYSPVKTLALANGLNVLQPDKLREPDFMAKLEALQPDLIVVVAFGQFLPQQLLDLPQAGCINVHASLLPQYRGAAPIHWAIMNGETQTGVTTMFMDKGMDTGDMLLKEVVDITPEETTGMLHDRLQSVGAELLLTTVQQLAAGKLVRQPQDNVAASYASLLTREIEKVDWNKSATEIHNKIRGLNPWPGAYCLSQGKILKLWETRVLPEMIATDAVPGTIIEHTTDGVVVAAGHGQLLLTEVQPASKRRMTAAACICGHNLVLGDILG